jgi:hypothetical protein
MSIKAPKKCWGLNPGLPACYRSILLQAIPTAPKTHFRCKESNRLKVKQCKKIFHEYSNQNRGWIAMLISNKTDFQSKKLQDKEIIVY